MEVTCQHHARASLPRQRIPVPGGDRVSHRTGLKVCGDEKICSGWGFCNSLTTAPLRRSLYVPLKHREALTPRRSVTFQKTEISKQNNMDLAMCQFAKYRPMTQKEMTFSAYAMKFNLIKLWGLGLCKSRLFCHASKELASSVFKAESN
jgi:hypothetical protein